MHVLNSIQEMQPKWRKWCPEVECWKLNAFRYVISLQMQSYREHYCEFIWVELSFLACHFAHTLPLVFSPWPQINIFPSSPPTQSISSESLEQRGSYLPYQKQCLIHLSVTVVIYINIHECVVWSAGLFYKSSCKLQKNKLRIKEGRAITKKKRS